MDIERLKKDWSCDPQINDIAFDTVEELADHLKKLHNQMLNGGHGVFGYLYKRQFEKLKNIC